MARGNTLEVGMGRVGSALPWLALVDTDPAERQVVVTAIARSATLGGTCRRRVCLPNPGAALAR